MHHFIARRSTRAAIAGLVLLFTAGTIGSQQVASAATNPSGSDLLAAVATAAEIQAVAPGSWAPLYPLFEVPGHETAVYSSGWVRSAMLELLRSDGAGATNGSVYSRLVLYEDDASAKAAYAAAAESDADGTTPLASVSTIGDESRAFTAEFPLANAPEDAYRMETFVRFRSGRMTGLVDAALPAHLTASQIGALAKPVAARMASVLSGTLTAPALPAALAAVMPPASIGTLAGPLMGQAALTTETYAFKSTDPGHLARAKSIGVTGVGYQAYATSAIAGHMLVVHVIPVKDEASARDFVLFDDAALTTPSLNTIPTGATGPYSIFRKDDSFDNYDYQLARNKYFVWLQCTPMDPQTDKVSDDCLAITRSAAEAIYAALPAGTLTPPPAATTTTTAAPLPPKTGSGEGVDRASGRPTSVIAGLLLMLASAAIVAATRRFSSR